MVCGQQTSLEAIGTTVVLEAVSRERFRRQPGVDDELLRTPALVQEVVNREDGSWCRSNTSSLEPGMLHVDRDQRGVRVLAVDDLGFPRATADKLHDGPREYYPGLMVGPRIDLSGRAN